MFKIECFIRYQAFLYPSLNLSGSEEIYHFVQFPFDKLQIKLSKRNMFAIFQWYYIYIYVYIH